MKIFYTTLIFISLVSCTQQKLMWTDTFTRTVNLNYLKGKWKTDQHPTALGFQEIIIDTDSTWAMYDKLREPIMSVEMSARRAATDYYKFKLTTKKPRGFKETGNSVYVELTPIENPKKRKYLKLVSLNDSILTLESDNYIKQYKKQPIHE